MKEELKKALDHCVEMGWITLNPHINENAVLDEFAARTLSLSFEEFKRWYLK